jgi:5-(carboxyamino)imidazole ribonucleotide synthase
MNPNLQIGIIGGGQLAKMLIENNPFKDAQIHVYCESLHSPATHSTSNITVGGISDLQILKNFLNKVQYITFESEFIPVELINEIRKDFPNLYILPDLKSMRILQNKLYQKFELKKQNIPTADFYAFNPEEDDLDQWLEIVFEKLDEKMVIKWAIGGYDGKGNFVVKNNIDLDNCKSFCKDAVSKGSSFYCESLIPFEKELARVYCRSLHGEFSAFPLVISEQENNICKIVYGPAINFGISKAMDSMSYEIGKKIAETLNYVGTFAIEFFYFNETLIVNEIAPRVHNSGHYTLDTAIDNQFSHHIRAIVGDKISTPMSPPFFSMLNLLGPKGLVSTNPENLLSKLKESEDYKVYWYEKSEIKPNRKLGHINVTAQSLDELNKKIELMKKAEVEIWELIKKESR